MCDSVSAAVRQNSESISNTANTGVSHEAIHAVVLAVRDVIHAYNWDCTPGRWLVYGRCVGRLVGQVDPPMRGSAGRSSGPAGSEKSGPVSYPLARLLQVLRLLMPRTQNRSG
jgi:hypothetical protein